MCITRDVKSGTHTLNSFIPPGLIHSVFTPNPSFARGGHFVCLDSMHLTEVARDIDAVYSGFTTNTDHPHMLETLVRLVLALPRLDPLRGEYLSSRPIGACTHTTPVLYRRPLLALCVQVLDVHRYHVPGTSQHMPNYLRMAQGIAEAVLTDMGCSVVEAHVELEKPRHDWKGPGEVYVIADEVLEAWRHLSDE